MLLRGSCHEIVLIDLPERDPHTRGVRNDLSHGGLLCPPARLTVGDYPDLRDASAVVITAGINEKAGKAIDPNDMWGRQRLLPHNAKEYRKLVPKIVEVAPHIPIVVVTDPPDSLADVALEQVKKNGGRNSVISAGTFLDTLRFRIQIAERLNCAPSSIDAFVIGEHGKTQVYVWSSARVGGTPVSDLIPPEYTSFQMFRSEVEQGVIDANIDIIRATDASQHGIGMVTARIVEGILRDEGLVAPVGTWQEEFKVTLSLPSVIGKEGVRKVLRRVLSRGEEQLLSTSGVLIARALENERNGIPVEEWI
jgi:L-lactate dehydrogenase